MHGKKFGCIRLAIREGEKHYPPVKPKWVKEFLHFVKNYEEQAVARMAMIYVYGENNILNFRAPNYKQLLEGNNLGHVWQKVVQKIYYYKSQMRVSEGLDVPRYEYPAVSSRSEMGASAK